MKPLKDIIREIDFTPMVEFLNNSLDTSVQIELVTSNREFLFDNTGITLKNVSPVKKLVDTGLI